MVDHRHLDPEKYDLLAAEPADCVKVCTLIENAPFKLDLWNWQFAERGAEKHCIVARYGAEVVGFNGAMPAVVWDGKHRSQALWSCDFAVRLDFRGRGVGSDIKRRLHERAECLMTVGVSPSAARVLLRSGWKELPGPAVMRYRRKTASARHRAPWRRHVAVSDTSVVVELRRKLPPADVCDALWEITSGSVGPCVVRDYTYLEWRYGRHPFGAYRYVVGRAPGGETGALAIIGGTDEEAVLVDYVGRLDRQWLREFFAEAITLFPEAVAFSGRFTDRRLIDALRQNRWTESQERPRFFVRAPRQLTSASWYLTAGDSDGEALSAARRHRRRFEIHEWSESEFLARRELWDGLLRSSRADWLFGSHAWQSAWWTVFGRLHGAELTVLAAVDEAGDLVGLTALVGTRVSMAGIPVARRLQFLGHLWGGPDTMRTEHCAILARRDQEQAVCYAIAERLAELRWDEFVADDVPYESMTFNAIHSIVGRNSLVRVRSDYRRGLAWGVETSRAFETYKAELDADVRRRMFHHRAKLANLGEIRFETHEAADVAGSLDLLNELHARRWGWPVFVDEWRAFHIELAARLPQDAYTPCFEVLRLNGEPISVLYNLKAGPRLYNIQSGFDPSTGEHRGLSIGLIHIGFSMEAAFADPGIEFYDFLAGSGKREFFKHRFCQTEASLAKIQYVRSEPHKTLYRMRDASVAWYRSTG